MLNKMRILRAFDSSEKAIKPLKKSAFQRRSRGDAGGLENTGGISKFSQFRIPQSSKLRVQIGEARDQQLQRLGA